jgi:hypothetical protein
MRNVAKKSKHWSSAYGPPPRRGPRHLEVGTTSFHPISDTIIKYSTVFDNVATDTMRPTVTAEGDSVAWTKKR